MATGSDRRSRDPEWFLERVCACATSKKARETEKRYGGKSTRKMFIYIMGEEVILNNEIFIYIMGEEVTLNEMSI
jgi:hypothetical protein